MFVYVVTNLVNSKRYIGQTTYDEVEKRWNEHLKCSRLKPSKRDGLLHKAIRKYGKQNFALNFVELSGVSQSILNSIERKMIIQVGTLAPHGYNLREGGDGGPMHPDTKEKIRISNKLFFKGKQLSPQCRAARVSKNPTKDRPLIEEHVENLRLAWADPNKHVGHREKFSVINIGRISPLKGTALTEEHKKKISLSLTGVSFTDERKKTLKGRIPWNKDCKMEKTNA